MAALWQQGVIPKLFQDERVQNAAIFVYVSAVTYAFTEANYDKVKSPANHSAMSRCVV